MTSLGILLQYSPYSSPDRIANALLFAGIAVACGLLLSWLFFYLSRREDRRGWIYERAPLLPVRSLAVHDDAWIRGIIQVANSLSCPWFAVECIYYSYECEEKRTRSVSDSKGNTRIESYWATLESDSALCPFKLVDGEAEIWVQAEGMDIKESESLGTDYEGWSLRHNARVVRVGEEVSLLGVKLEDESFGRLREVPLLLTYKGRDAFVASSHSTEAWYRRFAYFFVFLGAGIAAFLLQVQKRGPSQDTMLWILSAAAGLGMILPVWLLSAFNLLQRSQEKVKAAFRQIDVDLSVRDSLIPELMAVVEGYKKHERELFTLVAKLRSAQGRGLSDAKINNADRTTQVSKKLLALNESYPDLQANSQFMKLHEKLWVLEEKLAHSRKFFNDYVLEWNNLVGGFPDNLLAKVLGFTAKSHFRFVELSRDVG